MSLKNPVKTPEFDPGTFRLVAQRLNHYATPDPHNNYYKSPNYEQLRATIRKYDLGLIPLHEERGQKVNLSARSHSIIVCPNLNWGTQLVKTAFQLCVLYSELLT
jgi:hypothetical protein